MLGKTLWWVWYGLVMLALLGGLIGTVLAGAGFWAGAEAGAALGAWMLLGMYRWVLLGQLDRAQFAIREWRRVAEHWRERFREHVTEAHPEVPAQVYMTTAAWPRCGLDNRKPENTP